MVRTLVKDDKYDVATAAAEIIKNLIEKNNLENKPTVLGLATGSTPLPLYEKLIRLHEKEGLDFSRVVTFNLDEYVGLASDHPQSYYQYMYKNFFSRVNIKKENIHLLDGSIIDPKLMEKQILNYEQDITNAGGIDLQILGIGGNGHIAFNEPGSDIKGLTKVIKLDEKTRLDNSSNFKSLEDVPTEAISMGIGTILTKTAECILLATGNNKAEIIEKTLDKDASIDLIPAAALKLHPKALFLLDRPAARLLPGYKDKPSTFKTEKVSEKPHPIENHFVIQ